MTLPVGPTAAGTTVTANGANHTKGTYTQFTASTSFEANLLIVSILSASVSGGLYLLDIATGAGGSETDVVPNLILDRTSGASSHSSTGPIVIPLQIPAGTRVSCRCQCSTGGGTLEVALTLIAAGGVDGPSSWTQNGANTGTSGGTQVDPGVTINTKGSYVQLTGSLAAVAQIAILQISGIGTVGAGANLRWAIDIATGAAASEVVLIPDLRVVFAPIQDFPVIPRAITLLLYIPAGDRVAVRASCSSNDAVVRFFECALLTATAPAESSGSGAALSRVFAGF